MPGSFTHFGWNTLLQSRYSFHPFMKMRARGACWAISQHRVFALHWFLCCLSYNAWAFDPQNIPWGKDYNYLHFIDQEPWALRGYISYSRSHSKGVEAGFELSWLQKAQERPLGNCFGSFCIPAWGCLGSLMSSPPSDFSSLKMAAFAWTCFVLPAQPKLIPCWWV